MLPTMDRHPEPEPSDPSFRLTRDVYYMLVHTLRSSLPPPIDDTPEGLARRDNAAIAQVAAMLPANADEANLAADCVAARLYGMDCIRQAREAVAAEARRCAAQAVSMLREARHHRSLLARLQAARVKREADNAAADRAAWSEHCTIGLMTNALAATPPVARAKPAPPPPEPPADEEPQRNLAAEAEHYAIHYPRRARLIRSLGGLPDNPNFGPPDPDLVAAIVTGTTPHLRALDVEVLREAAD